MRILIYARVSTEEQARTGFSLTEQLRACRERAQTLSPTAQVTTFTDDASGELLERPGLQAALDLLRQEKAAYFVCLDPDRLARRLMHQLLVTDEIERSGCRLEFVQHNYQETPEGRLFYQMRGAIAEFEKAKILERTSRGQRGKIASGGLPHSIRMYGYRFVKGAGKLASAREALVPEPHEAEVVKQIYRWSATEGLSPAAIARRLNDLGIPTKTHRGLWRSIQVERILRHPAYATGRLALRKADHRGIGVARRLTREQRLQKGMLLRARPRPSSEWLYVEIEPVVAADLWEQAQPRSTANHRRSATENLLTGLGRCGVCGAALHYLGGRTIACSARWAPGSTCTLPAKDRTAVEEAVWLAVSAELVRPEVLAAAQSGTPPDEAPLLLAERERRSAELERVGLLFARGLWPAEKALPELERLGEQLQRLDERLQACEKGRPAGATPDFLTIAPEFLSDLPPERRAELLRLAVSSFALHPSGRGAPPRVTVTFR